MEIAESLLLVAHVGLAAVWIGAMVYSLFVVQPKAARFFASDEETHEAFVATLASGNRWPVLATVAGLAATGAALWAIADTPGWAAHVVKGVLLLAALAVFVYVSWRHWPRRVFAVPEERSALRRQLRVCALTILGLVGTAFLIGVLTGH